ncbi:endonuclease/exonuclease/phosphatase family protein [Citrifermentans bemidjiense Bem]|uniref:Endonuclease/exonuclease/phosphatase family protein n=1 Tax=Citrifermentans bemidjiense (strain ATCC BAA-1014 / DSM 16622 / JCM 12645 / Bem) TaxID=404380 RepID=B5EAR9_CITBB|nr:endonuclease/exonuclease/phosphatase family protein [Citrifermentans bemidjiense]ACH37378.1 endonuclease/exonuclease/phosphatase family protein [Citrifermentans bemidjiense Bem]
MRPVLWLNLLYAAVIAAIALSHRIGADRFWPGALNLYLPQVMWALPGIILLPVTWKAERPWVWLPLCALMWVIGPVMGYNWPLNREKGEVSGTPLRVMTWNIKYGKHDLMPLVEELERSRPDIVLFQDAVRAGAGPLAGYFKDWHLLSQGRYLIASRYPLSAAEVFELPYSGRSKEYLLRCKVRVGSSEISLYDVHFKTPRRSLNAFRKAKQGPWYIPDAVERFEDNVTLRLIQARTVAGYLSREKGPVLVAGDLNSPDSSLVCRTLREAGLADAFAAAGEGYGYTYGHFLLKNRIPLLRVSWMRIDHVMTNSWLTASRCRVGTGRASDHRPVIADFLLKNSP